MPNTRTWPEPVSVFFLNENPDSTLMLNGLGKTRPIKVGSGRVLAGRVHFAIPNNSFLNIEYLIAKLQANLARNKANTWLNIFNLTISPFGYSKP